ncbi:MAG: lycopene cyclase domain-containing protein [bacterium]|nr:lycopene cyclase domain-containing protein [bacterium]
MEYQYTYLLLGAFFVAGWFFLYIRRKDERRELLMLSSMFAVFGVASDFLYIQDWWTPLSVLGTPPFTGESLITAFGIVGVGAVLPEYLLRLKDTSCGRVFTHREVRVLCISVFTMAILFYGSFYLLGVNSLVATILALAIPTAFMWGSRPDLISTAFINGLALVVFTVVIYTAVEFITPGWVNAFFLFKNTPHIILLNVPIDDVVFYFCAGLFFGTFYEWWQGIKRVPLRNKSKKIRPVFLSCK